MEKNTHCAVIIPCYNEEITISKVIEDFLVVLPEAKIYVFDNNSTDNTYQLAKDAGAIVLRSPSQGKGNVIRHAFSVVDADIYIMIDGDSQYDVTIIPQAIEKFSQENLDMLTLTRKTEYKDIHRFGHTLGNKFLTNLVNFLLKNKCTDMLSGYMVLSKAFVKSFPAHSKGFELETELNIFAYQMRMLTNEMEVSYKSRPTGSFSKLNTIKDGIIILKTILYLVITEKSFLFFGTISFLLGSLGVFWVIDIYLEFLSISAVPRFPTFILAMSLLFSASLSLVTGVILFYIQQNTLEQRRYTYLKYKKEHH